MKRRAVSLGLCLCMLFSLVLSQTVCASRDFSFENGLAQDLKTLGLFNGVSDTDFALERAPSRIEALVMLIRVLGKEDEALKGKWRHPFGDVPEWADKYIGYAYNNGLANGISETEFGGGSAGAGTYLTFMLRAMDYSDKDGRDFSWDDPYALAGSVGILPSCVDTEDFLRADAVTVSYAALNAKLNGGGRTLSAKLIGAGVFTKELFEKTYDKDAIATYENKLAAESKGNEASAEQTDKKELTAEEIYRRCSPAVFYLETYDAYGEILGSGSGFFIDSDGTAVTNFHVIDGAVSAVITMSDGKRSYDIEGVYDYSAEHDWAVIHIAGKGFQYLELGDPAKLSGGSTVYAIGSPLGLQNSISQGIVSNTNRQDGTTVYIQTTAAISPGSSGGALINKYGEVVGVTSAYYADGQNLNLALPVTYFKDHASGKLMELLELPASNRRQRSYDLLLDFVLGQYTYVNGDYVAYDEGVQFDNGDVLYCALSYTQGENRMALEGAYIFADGGEVYTYIYFEPGDKDVRMVYYSYYEDSEAANPMFYGSGKYEPSLGGIYSFDSCSGNLRMRGWALESVNTEISSLVGFGDYLFENYISGGYSMEDLGF